MAQQKGKIWLKKQWHSLAEPEWGSNSEHSKQNKCSCKILLQCQQESPTSINCFCKENHKTSPKLCQQQAKIAVHLFTQNDVQLDLENITDKNGQTHFSRCMNLSLLWIAVVTTQPLALMESLTNWFVMLLKKQKKSLSIRQGYFSKQWKIAKIIPFPKKKSTMNRNIIV